MMARGLPRSPRPDLGPALLIPSSPLLLCCPPLPRSSRTLLWVSDPLQPGKNAAKNCFRILAIQKQMKIAYDKAEAMLMQGTGEEDRAGSGLLEKVFGCTGWGQ